MKSNAKKRIEIEAEADEQREEDLEEKTSRIKRTQSENEDPDLENENETKDNLNRADDEDYDDEDADYDADDNTRSEDVEEDQDLDNEDADYDADDEAKEKRSKKGSRSVEVVFTTPNPVLRNDERGPYYEILSMQGCNLERLQSGRAPFLKDHSNEIDSVLGRVVSARVESGRGIATIHLSSRPEIRSIYNDMKAGILSGVSVGYTVHESRAIDQQIDSIPCRLVTKWEPHEISLVSIPADPQSKIEGIRGLITRMFEPKKSSPIKLDRLARSVGLSSDFINALRAANVTPEQGKKAIKKELKRRGSMNKNQHRSIVITRDEKQTKREGLEQALLHRMDGKRWKMTEKARSFADFSLLDTEAELSGRAPRRGFGMMYRDAGGPSATSSDFPILLSNVMNKNLRALFDEAPGTYEAFTRQITVRDFKPTYFMQMSEGFFPEEITENDPEVKRTNFQEAAEEIRPKRFASSYSISREAILNDDLGALQRISQVMAHASQNFISREVYIRIADGNGQPMANGRPLFCREHKNVGYNPGPITIESLASARSAMRLQTGLSGRVINLVPKFLVTSAKRELEAQQLLSQSLLAGVISTLSPEQRVNPFANGSLVHICEPRLDEWSGQDDPYYLIADPSQTDTVVLAYLQDSGPGPQVFSRTEFGARMNITIELLLEFGLRVLEHRAFYKQGLNRPGQPQTGGSGASGGTSSGASSSQGTEREPAKSKKEGK